MPPPKTPNAKRGTIHGSVTQNAIKFTIRAAPLPSLLVRFLQASVPILKRVNNLRNAEADSGSRAADEEIMREGDLSVGGYDAGGAERASGIEGVGVGLQEEERQFWDTFEARCAEAGGEWAQIAHRVWAFGPRRAGSCVLIDARSHVAAEGAESRLIS